jgi:hypothetical protein
MSKSGQGCGARFLKDFPKGVSKYRYLLNQGLTVEAALLKMGVDRDYVDRWSCATNLALIRPQARIHCV